MIVTMIVMVARVAFSTHCMCTGNTRWPEVGRRGPRVTGREDSRDSRGAVLLLSRSFSRLLPFLPFLHSLPSFRCQCTIAYSSRYAIAYRSANSRRNPRDKPRRYNARDIRDTRLPFHRERRDLSVRHELSISRSLVRMPFPQHCRRRNAVFANLGALHPVKPISGSPSMDKACTRTPFHVSFLIS